MTADQICNIIQASEQEGRECGLTWVHDPNARAWIAFGVWWRRYAPILSGYQSAPALEQVCLSVYSMGWEAARKEQQS